MTTVAPLKPENSRTKRAKTLLSYVYIIVFVEPFVLSTLVRSIDSNAPGAKASPTSGVYRVLYTVLVCERSTACRLSGV